MSLRPSAVHDPGTGSTRAVERALALLAEVCEGDVTTLAEAARRTRLAAEHGPAAAAHPRAHRLRRPRRPDGSWRPGAPVHRARRHRPRAGVAGAAGRAVAAPHRRRRTGETTYLIVAGAGGQRGLHRHGRGHPLGAAHQLGRSHHRRPRPRGRPGAARRRPAAGGLRSPNATAIEPDVTAIAAPIRRPGGVAGALNLLGPTYRIDETDACTRTAASSRARPRRSAGCSAPTSRPIR